MARTCGIDGTGRDGRGRADRTRRRRGARHARRIPHATVRRPSAPRAANTLGMWRAAFLVADLDAAVAELTRSAIDTISAPVTMAMGPGLPTLRFVCFRGPDDEVLELIEQPAS